MITKKQFKHYELISNHPATVEMARCQVLIDRLRRRLRRYAAAHPERCRCAVCRSSHPELRMNIAGLAATLGAFSAMIDMERLAG